MTRVFVYEYTCAAPPALLKAGGAASLSTEGAAMLRAALADFRKVPGVEAFTILQEPDEESAFRAAARRADWSLVIAPEFHDILLTRCRWVLEEGSRLLGPSPDAVRLCGDKLALFRWLDERHVSTPETRLAQGRGTRGWNGSFVRKPRFGAGSQDTFLIQSGSATGPSTSALGEMIEQAFVSGLAASVSFIVGRSSLVPLAPCSQILSDDGQFHYYGGRVPLAPHLAQRTERVAIQALSAMGQLFGYVGVDVVLGDDRHDWVIEINPRLTTSYIGLRASAETNLAEVMLRVAEGGAAPPIAWRPGTVEFTPDDQTRFA